MDPSRLQAIGLSVTGSGEELTVELELDELPVINPLTRARLPRISFRLVGETLVPHAPPELAWIAPFPLSRIARAAELKQQVSDSFDEYVLTLERRSTELQAMGVNPDVDPSTLELTALLREAGFELLIAADRRGNLELVRARKDGAPLDIAEAQPFELSEHRDKAALVAYLISLVDTRAGASAASRPMRFRELAERFHPNAFVPPASPVEVLVELEVSGVRHRFAAARIAGRTFRGLLASHRGKIWAGRFELDTFPGVIKLVSELLKVAPEQITVVAGNEE